MNFKEFLQKEDEGLNEGSRNEFIPVKENKDGSWEVDDSYEGDAFELSKDEMHKIKQKRVRFMYDSGLFGKTDKRVYISQHPSWEGWMISKSELK